MQLLFTILDEATQAEYNGEGTLYYDPVGSTSFFPENDDYTLELVPLVDTNPDLVVQLTVKSVKLKNIDASRNSIATVSIPSPPVSDVVLNVTICNNSNHTASLLVSYKELLFMGICTK